jgi:hypothetical protein
VDFRSGTVIPTASTATISAAAATATATFFRFIDTNRAAVERRAIHAFHGFLSIVVALERHKTKTTTAAGLTIEYHAGFPHFTERFKGRFHGIVRRIPTEATYE